MAKKRVILDLSGLRNLRARIDGVMDTALYNTAIFIRDDAIRDAPKDTEYLADSIHIVSMEHSDYALSKANSTLRHQAALATGYTPKGVRIGPNSNYNFFPEIRPDVPGQIWIVVGAMHGIANEEGVHGRTPFMASSVYKNKGVFTGQIRNAFNGLQVRAVVSKNRRDSV